MKWLQKGLLLVFIFFLISCSFTGKPNIRLNAGGVEMELTRPVPLGVSLDYSPNGKYIAIGGWGDGGITVWDIVRGLQIGTFAADSNTRFGIPMGVHVAFSPNGNNLVSVGKDIKLWDMPSGKEIRTIGHKSLYQIVVSNDGNKFLATETIPLSNANPDIVLWDIKTGTEIKRFIVPFSLGLPACIALSPDGKYALSGHVPGGGVHFLMKLANIVLWDTETGEALKVARASETPGVYFVAFSSDGKYARSGGTDGTIRLWEIPSLKEIKTFKAHTRLASSSAISPNGKNMITGGGDGLVKLWDISSGSQLRTFEAYSGESSTLISRAIGYVAFSPDGKYIISAASDGSFRIWNAATGEEIALLIGFEGGEWLAITSEGYYNSSEKGAQYLKVKFEGTDYTVDQFYDVFYRPDIVAAKLSGQDISGLISITMKDARKFPPPLVEFTSHTPGNDQQKAKVCYQVKSTGGGIGEIRLFHNGKLIQSDGYYREVAKSTAEKTQLVSLGSKAIYEDMRSVSIKGKTDTITVSSKSKGEAFEDCKEIDAMPGENEISVTAFNSSNTVQSYMKTINFNSQTKAEDPHLYILSIGIDQYTDGNVNLKYAVKDAKDLEEKLKTQSATLYKQENIHYSLLTDQEATKTNIYGKINELTQKIKPQDSFILFVAGHGVLLQNQYYMLTHDFNGEVSNTSMISSNEIVEMSKKIKSLSQLFIFDTCHAGGVDTIVSGLYDARMSVLAKKMGLHIYASASDKQSAMDGYKGNGLFTYTLLNGLNNNKEADKNKDGKVTVVGLGEYSKKMTTEISKEVGHSQTPLIINFGKDSPIYKLQ